MAEELHKEDAVPEQLMQLRKGKSLAWKIPLCIVVALALLAGGLWGLWLYNDVSLVMDGLSEEITLEYGTTFETPQIQAYLQGKLWPKKPMPVSVEVTVDGTVDSYTLGTYDVTCTAEKYLNYRLGSLRFAGSCDFQVHVVDTTPPQIQLVSNPDYFTLPGTKYMEEGFTAIDNCDGDLTSHVVRWEQGDVIYYKVTDNAANETLVTREIHYDDPVAPELTLQGKETVIVVQGKEYTEPGYSAKDNLDGELTEKVTVSGSVDTQSLGSYELRYSVTDSYSNTTEVVRTVIVREYPELPDNMPMGVEVERVRPEGKVVYLTFDDGPSVYTEMLLDVLKKYNVKATFFVVDRGYPDTLRRIVDEGHTIAMHCGTHTYGKIYTSEEAYFSDLKRIQDVILKETGVLTTIARFPGGTGNTVSRQYNQGIMTRLTKMLDAMNYRYFDWNVSSGDASDAHTKEAIFNNVINGIMNRNVSIVLQHDIKYDSVLAVEDIIKWCLKHGYRFMPLDMSSPTCEVKPRN